MMFEWCGGLGVGIYKWAKGIILVKDEDIRTDRMVYREAELIRCQMGLDGERHLGWQWIPNIRAPNGRNAGQL